MKTKFLFPLLIFAALVNLTSCSKDDDDKAPTLNKTSITLYVDDTATLTYSGGNCTWSSDNELIASVKNGVITGEHVGTTTIHANKATCKVTVKPRYTNVFEPCLQWGANQSTIKQYMSGYTLLSSSSTSLLYAGNGVNDIMGYAYSFENGKLSLSMLMASYYAASYVTDFLLERYAVIDVDQDSYTAYMITPDFTTGIILIFDDSALEVGYIPIPESTKSVNRYDYKFNKAIINKAKQELPKNNIEKISDVTINEIFSRLQQLK